MAITLTESILDEHRYDEQETFDLAVGEKVRFQKQVAGQTVDVLALQTVPTGKKWNVVCTIRILETNV